jgi:MFS family permease
MGYWSPAASSFSKDFDISDTGHKRKRDKLLGTVYNMLAPGACVFGSPLIDVLIKRIGRKYSSVAVAGFACISWLLMGVVKYIPNFSDFFWLACVIRAFLGLSVGATSGLIPMYITELAPDHLRGAFGTLHQLGISIGASLCYTFGCIKPYPRRGSETFEHYLSWWQLAFLSCIPTGLHLLLVWFVPESPVVARVEESKQQESLWQKKYIRPMVISLFLMFFQQFGGTSAFLANLDDIFRRSGSSLNSRVSCLLVGLAGALATLIGSPLIGLFGRKLAWNISSLVQFLALALNAMQKKYEWSNAIPIVCLFVDNFAFGIGTAPIPWFFVPELFPDTVRSLAAGLISGCCWIMGTVLFLIWDVMKDSKGFGEVGGFSLFAGIMGFSLIFGLTILPEPKTLVMGGDIEDVDAPYDSRPLVGYTAQITKT